MTMATLSPFFTTYTPKSLPFQHNNTCSLTPRNPILHFQPNKTKPLHSSSSSSSFHGLNPLKNNNFFTLKTTTTTILKSSEEENPVTEEQQQQQEVVVEEEAAEQQTVSVPVSPSDTLTMFFQAEGTMNETTIPAVTSVLEQTDGVTNLKVQILESIASVELMKQTTIQATGVASSLVEAIQGAGFKLQTLNLSFEDEEEVLV